MLGVGVADGSGYINTGLKLMLSRTPLFLLTPMVIFVGIVSHSAVDAGYVLVIPLGGIIFYTAGRHPLAGISAAFAGVSGGFSANPIPSALDPLLQGFTQPAAHIIDTAVMVNPLCNYYFTAASSVVITLLGWYITDRIIEPRLNKNTPVDKDAEQAQSMSTITKEERKGFWVATFVSLAGLVLLALSLYPANSPFRDANGVLTSFTAPIMQSIVPLIFLLFLIPGVIYGYISGKFKKGKDVIDEMSEAMRGMAYYVVMAFFCSLFIYAFATSNLGALLAIKGANFLKALHLPGPVTITGIIFLAGFVNLFVGSASAKWALLAPIFVPMLMQLGYSPELTQAAYRVGDSSTNIITPLMPYFPLVVVFCQKYVKDTGIGTLVSIMIPYSIAFIIIWTLFLISFWVLGIPLGLQATYVYPG
jgi:aminobenzoyl-glutamate transport protein